MDEGEFVVEDGAVGCSVGEGFGPVGEVVAFVFVGIA